MKVSWDDDIPNIWKNKTCSKPSTIYIYIWFHVDPMNIHRKTVLKSNEIHVLQSHEHSIKCH